MASMRPVFHRPISFEKNCTLEFFDQSLSNLRCYQLTVRHTLSLCITKRELCQLNYSKCSLIPLYFIFLLASLYFILLKALLGLLRHHGYHVTLKHTQKWKYKQNRFVKMFLKILYLLVWLRVIDVYDFTHNISLHTRKSIDDAIFLGSAPLLSPGYFCKLLTPILQVCMYVSVCIFYKDSCIFLQLFMLKIIKPIEKLKELYNEHL